MKTIIKIALALAIIVAAFNAGWATFTNYRFEDSVHDALLYNPRASETEIAEMVNKAAADYDLTVDPADITVKNVYPDVHVDFPYTRTVVLLPGIYSIDWKFTPSASTRFLPGTGGPR
jgi:hypothetical protein